MLLVRVWRRQLLGGMGAAVVVPGALLASLAVLALAGGFAGLAALGQALSGPPEPLPGQTLAAARGGTAARPVGPTLAVALSSSTTHPGSANATGAPAAGTGPASSSAPASTGGPSPRTSPGSGARTHAPLAPHTTTTPQGPEPQPTVADRVVGVGTSVTSQLPTPAGQAATGALQSAGSTLDSIAPIKSP
jgi:hypothetical protein